MKWKSFRLLATGLLISSTLMAQGVSKDSINTLNDQKKVIDLSAEINHQKLKLAELENSLKDKISSREKQKDQAQESADDNASIASDLSENPNSKKLARKAKKAAKEANQQAKQARKSEGRLKGLENDIESLKKRIAANEKKLLLLQGRE